MRVDVVEDGEGTKPVFIFPPEKDYWDLRESPGSIENIAAARRYLPLRNFLATVNAPDSLFIATCPETRANSAAEVSDGPGFEFASQTVLLFADLSLNLEKSHFTDLGFGLKKLLERDSADSVRIVLRISSCEFPSENRPGYSMSIRLVATGESSQQAELRWGLGLARFQQALLFQARALKQQTGK